MKASLIVAAAMTLGMSASAFACSVPNTVFHCTTKTAKVIQICDNGNGTATYTYGSAGKPDKTITSAYKDISTGMTPKGTARNADFSVGKYTYSVMWPTDNTDTTRVASVEVLDGIKTVADIKCAGSYIANGDSFWTHVNN